MNFRCYEIEGEKKEFVASASKQVFLLGHGAARVVDFFWIRAGYSPELVSI